MFGILLLVGLHAFLWSAVGFAVLAPIYWKSRMNGKAFIAWERLRVIFLLILVAISGRGLAPIWRALDLKSWMMIGVGALLVNILFLLGPITESLSRLGGVRKIVLRCTFFIGGTALTAFTVFIYIAALHMTYLGI